MLTRLLQTGGLCLLALTQTACSTGEDPSAYSACSFFDDRYIAHGAKCVDDSGDVVKIEDSGANWLGYVQGQ